MIFNVLLTLAALAGGAIASVAGCGMGSILTPALAARIGTKLAVAAVSIPHVCGTVLRLWVVRQRINRHVIVSFGLASAAGWPEHCCTPGFRALFWVMCWAHS